MALKLNSLDQKTNILSLNAKTFIQSALTMNVCLDFKQYAQVHFVDIVKYILKARPPVLLKLVTITGISGHIATYKVCDVVFVCVLNTSFLIQK